MHSFNLRWVSALSLVLTLLCLGVVTPTRVYAAFFSVTTYIDDPSATACTGAPYNCSLRGAISLANANGGDNLITLPAFGAGPYSLTHGVLNITNNLTINGAGAGITIISGGNATPIFSIPFNVFTSTGLTLNLVTLTEGLNAGMADGGCIVNNHTLVLNRSIVDHCHAGQDGGGIYNGGGGTLQLNNSIVQYNIADRDCGGICDYGVSVTVNGSTIMSNTAQTGVVGGLGTNGVVVTLTNSIVMSNTAAGDGGGLYNNKLMTLIHVSVIGNIANPGGQNRGGGGLYNNAGSATISDSTFSGNQARGGEDGGGISIASGSTARLMNVTLSNNSAIRGGGIDSAGTLTLTNVTLSGNSALASGGGGVANAGTATLTNVTFSGNAANAAGGILNQGTATLTNTIVAASQNSPNCEGFASGGSFNLSDDGSCGFGSGRDNVNNLMLAPLGNYGGPTLTHIPRLGSFAIDRGTNAGCTAFDQRGQPRPVGLACDVGAVERQLFDFPFSYLYLPLIRK